MLEPYAKIPEVLKPILDSLDELDAIKKDELEHVEFRRVRRLSGRDLLSNAIREGFLGPSIDYPNSFRGTPVNVIPPHRKHGPCAQILVVFIGETDNFELRVLEAIEHCAVLCRGATKYVIFYTMIWNDVIWKKHENSFRLTNLTVIQKPFGRPPIRIL